MNIHHQRIRRFCAVVIGFVFVLSGTFKLMDPVGSSLKVTEYWNFFHMGFMKWSSMAAGVGLSLVEAILGLMLVSGMWRKATAVMTWVMTVFFTILTAVLAIVNPSMDCGCFGEVLHLDNTQTLLKNLVLLGLCCIAFLPMRDFGKPKARKYVSFGIGVCSSLALLIYSLLNLPVKDFTDYSPGTQLAAARTEAESQSYEATFIYEKNGEERVFSLEEDLPDTSWHFVRAQTGIVADESVRLAISDWSTGECLDSLAAEGNVMVLSYYRKGDEKPRATELLRTAGQLGYRPICLALDPQGHNDECFSSDRRGIMGLNRSNGGLTVIQDGMIVRKWPSSAYPDNETLVAIANGEPLETISDVQSASNLKLQSYLLFVVTVLLIL